MQNLSITQEYLLCAVNEKGKISGFDTEKLACFVAAALLEMQQAGCINISENCLHLVQTLPQDKTYLRSLYQFIAQFQPIKLDGLPTEYKFSVIEKQLHELMDAVAESLGQIKLVQIEKAGIFSSKKAYIPDQRVVRSLVDKIRTDLFQSSEVPQQTLALSILLEKGRILHSHFSDFERKDIQHRIKELVNALNDDTIRKATQQMDDLLAMINLR